MNKDAGVWVSIVGTSLGWTEHTARNAQGEPIVFHSTDSRDEAELRKRLAAIRAGVSESGDGHG